MLLVFFPELRLLLMRVFLDKSIQFLIKYKKYRYIYYIYIKYFTSYFGLRTRELKEGKMKEVLEIIYQYRDNIGYLKIYYDYYKIWWMSARPSRLLDKLGVFRY